MSVSPPWSRRAGRGSPWSAPRTCPSPIRSHGGPRTWSATRTSYSTSHSTTEFQTRGVVHFHAVIRLDGPTPLVSPPAWAAVALLAQVVRDAARRARVSTPDSAVVRARRLRWGGQLDIRPIAVDGEVSDALVARYIAKYATKAAEAAGITLGPIWCRACTGLGATPVTTDTGRQATVFCRSCRGHRPPQGCCRPGWPSGACGGAGRDVLAAGRAARVRASEPSPVGAHARLPGTLHHQEPHVLHHLRQAARCTARMGRHPPRHWAT
jgi:Replication initiator protein, pSAM2